MLKITTLSPRHNEERGWGSFVAIYLVCTAVDIATLIAAPRIFLCYQVFLRVFNMSMWEYQCHSWALWLGPLTPSTTEVRNRKATKAGKTQDNMGGKLNLAAWFIKTARCVFDWTEMRKGAELLRGTASKCFQEMDNMPVGTQLTEHDIKQLFVKHLGLSDRRSFQLALQIFAPVKNLAMDHPHPIIQGPFIAMVLLSFGLLLPLDEQVAALYMDTVFPSILWKLAHREMHSQITCMEFTLESLIYKRPEAYHPPLHKKKLDQTNFSLEQGHVCPGYSCAAYELAATAAYNRRVAAAHWKIDILETSVIVWKQIKIRATKVQ